MGKGKFIIMKKINIAILTTSLNSGGAERIAGLLSKELENKQMYNVYVFLLSTSNIIYEYGGMLVDIGQNGPFYEKEIKKNKIKYNIQISISFLEIMNFANVRTQIGERIILSERCVQSLMNPFLDAQELKIKRYYNLADEIVACSHGVKYDLEHNYKVQTSITTIYNFINKEKIQIEKEKNIEDDVLRFLNGTPYLLNVGRLDSQKNQSRLIKQFVHYRKKRPNIKLIILGSGDLKDKLSDLISENNEQENIAIFPYTKNPFMYMKNAVSLVITSHYEGLPNVVLEAMTVGCPIVSTDCLAGPRELLSDITTYDDTIDSLTICKRGILVPDQSSEDDLKTTYLADAMEKIVDNVDLRNEIINNQKIYMRDYSNNKIVKQWCKLIKKKDIKPKEGKFEDDIINVKKKICIYGAGKIGTYYYNILHEKYQIDSFVVSQKNNISDSYMGLPVYELRSLSYNNEQVQFIIGVGDNTQDDVVRGLKEKGYTDIVFPYI